MHLALPHSPTEVGFYDSPGFALGVYLSGNYVYLADYDYGLRVVDISTPTNPTEVGFYDSPGFASGVTVSGNYAYLADSSGLRVVDIYGSSGICSQRDTCARKEPFNSRPFLRQGFSPDEGRVWNKFLKSHIYLGTTLTSLIIMGRFWWWIYQRPQAQQRSAFTTSPVMRMVSMYLATTPTSLKGMQD